MKVSRGGEEGADERGKRPRGEHVLVGYSFSEEGKPAGPITWG
jgi:hypothetical protein